MRLSRRLSRRKERERQARIDDILEAAKSLFDERGYEATTMAGIARRAGFSKSALYFYFKSKDEIYVTLIVEALGDLHRQLEETLPAETRPWRMGEKMFDAFVEFLYGRKSYYDALVIFNPQDNPAVLPKELEERWAKGILSNMDLVVDLIKAAFGERERPISDDDARQRAFSLLGIGLGAYALTQVRGDILKGAIDQQKVQAYMKVAAMNILLGE